jgi:hypothetical protein
LAVDGGSVGDGGVSLGDSMRSAESEWQGKEDASEEDVGCRHLSRMRSLETGGIALEE